MNKKLKTKIDELQAVIAFCYGVTQGVTMLGSKTSSLAIQVIKERIEEHPDWKPDTSGDT